MIKIVDASSLNLADHIRAGDALTWGQASSEPLTLIDLLIEQRADIGKISAFIGLSLTHTLKPEHTDFISLSSYGALGTTTKLVAAGVMELLPCHYSSVPNLIDSGRLPVDVVFIQISEPGPDGTHSLGFCNDYLKNAMNKARLVIAEINAHVPWSRMDAPLDEARIDFAITTDRQPPTVTVPPPGDIDQKIAAHVASVIEDGATLQYGVGSIPAAILNALGHHKDLGLHSGLITEEVIDLVENGVITNARKAVHTGISVGAIAIGGPRLKDFLHDNASFEMHPSSTTHGPATLSQIDNLVAMNSALEVDLYGQINAEQVGDRYLGAIGGQVDFMHAATTAANGISLIAMPASLGKSGGSRIAAKLGGPFVTTARTDVDMVITEYGIADLRGKTLVARARSIIDIALPEHRNELSSHLQSL
jgi:acyl-CoA hydrolase